MTFFFAFLSLILSVGLGLAGFYVVKQKAAIIVLQKSSKNASDELAKCRGAYKELKTKAEDYIRRVMQTANEEKNKATNLSQVIALQQEKMKRWQVIVDAEAEANRILVEAKLQSDQIHVRAQQFLISAEAKARDTDQNAQRLVDLAKREAEDLGVQARSLLSEARSRAEGIIAEAHKNAGEIAGEAYEVKQNVTKFERILRAIKNEIDGYGDEYIVPAHSLLDDLAEDVSYAKAGQELKAIRARLKEMVKHGKAAECDYAEANRRETAIRFVTDAFNGKVDSILTRIRLLT